MTKLRGLILAGLTLTIAACSGFAKHSEIEALNEVQPVGSPFTQYLAAEYRDYANSENTKMMDYPDAIHFARKGLAAAAGDVVMPEPISDWNLLPAHIEELSVARGRLVSAFGRGARDVAPQLSAVAQARFDCWIEQQEENWQLDHIIACKSQFLDALNQLDSMLPRQAPQADDLTPVAALNTGSTAAPMAVEDALYLVFFDFDQYSITSGANSVLDAVAAEAKKRNVSSIEIVGHTDTSGANNYNDRLAVQRADSVRNALVGRGLNATLIRAEGRGERDQLVQTGDNVREPANRRAQITFK